jgi:hypothetical protein
MDAEGHVASCHDIQAVKLQKKTESQARFQVFLLL